MRYIARALPISGRDELRLGDRVRAPRHFLRSMQVYALVHSENRAPPIQAEVKVEVEGNHMGEDVRPDHQRAEVPVQDGGVHDPRARATRYGICAEQTLYVVIYKEY